MKVIIFHELSMKRSLIRVLEQKTYHSYKTHIKEDNMSQAIKIRYLYDQNGNRTDVIIPISVWGEDIEQIIRGKIIKKEKFDPADYIGIINYSGTPEDLDKEIKHLRDEWERL